MLLALCACGGKGEEKKANVFQVGFGRVDLTPTSPMDLVGRLIFLPRATQKCLQSACDKLITGFHRRKAQEVLYEADGLSLREKVLQTVVLRCKNDRPVTESVGAVFFGGEIITEAEDIGLEAAMCPLPMIPG